MTRIIRHFGLATALLLLASCGTEPQPDADETPAALVGAPAMQEGPRIDNPFAGGNTVMSPDAASTTDPLTRIESDPVSDPDTPRETPAYVPPAEQSARFSCSPPKRVCREMASCEEAVFHLEQCGVSRLDGDGDGTPCEKICG